MPTSDSLTLVLGATLGPVMRSVEPDLLGRPGLTHAILRPAWFMQNFSETCLRPAGGAIVVQAFVDKIISNVSGQAWAVDEAR